MPSMVRAAALRLLGRRDYTRAELRQKLTARGYRESDIEETLEQLSVDGTVDDRRAAATHVRLAAHVKGRGRIRMERELLARGIAGDVAAEALAALSEDDEVAALKRVLARKRVPARMSMAERHRIFQQLLRRGFRADVIAQVLKMGRGETE